MCTMKKPDWSEIIPVYEKVIKSYLKKDMLKSSAKQIMLKEILCFIAFDDVVGGKKKFNYFCSEDPSLGPGWEGEFLEGVL